MQADLKNRVFIFVQLIFKERKGLCKGNRGDFFTQGMYEFEGLKGIESGMKNTGTLSRIFRIGSRHVPVDRGAGLFQAGLQDQ